MKAHKKCSVTRNQISAKKFLSRKKTLNCVLATLLPHFQEPLEGAMGDFLVEVHEDVIACQTATLQFFHM